MIDETKILKAFAGLPFEVKGIGIMREEKGITTVCKRNCNEYDPIGLNDTCNGGYIRYNGETIYTPQEQLSACSDDYKCKVELQLVLGTKDYKIETLKQSMLWRISTIEGVTLKRVSENKQTIISEEKMPLNTLDLLKFVFDYEFDYIKPCEDVELDCDC